MDILLARYYLYNMKMMVKIFDKYDYVRIAMGEETQNEILKRSRWSVLVVAEMAHDAYLLKRILLAIFNSWKFRTAIGYGVITGRY